MDTMAKVKTAFGASVGSFTAGSGGDNALVTSDTVDREDFFGLSVCLGWSTTLSASQSLSALVTVEDSEDGSTFGTLATWSGTLATTSGSSTKDIDVPILGAKKYIRVLSRLDLSAANTDTASYFVVYVLGDATRKPV